MFKPHTPLYLIALFAILLASSPLLAQQLPQINYQGVARKADGSIISDQAISLRLTIRDGVANGASTNVYSETRKRTTSKFGLFTVVIGSAGATAQTGAIAAINWATGNKFLQVELDPLGGNSFIDMGTSQLQSVPYAIYASTAAPTGTAGGDLGGSYPNPIVKKLNGAAISITAPLTGQVLKWNGSAWTPANELASSTGPQGIPGSAGAAGAKGDIGLTGAAGAIGTAGTTGPQGLTGATGTAGSNGTIGATGLTGAIGATGLTGTAGSNGTTGATGDIGLTGATGSIGLTGATGLTGASGTNGAAGPIGLTGAAGSVGATGTTGLTGAAGTNGAAGLTTSVNGVTQVNGAITLNKTDIGLGNVNNTTDLLKPVSTATQTALDLKASIATLSAKAEQSAVDLKAPLASPTFTGTVAGVTKTMVGLGDVNNTTDAAKPVSTATQTALDAKSSNADVALKAPLASPTFTGTVAGITKAMVGLGDVNNTTDLLKPISTATQTALDAKSSNADVALKAPLASPTFTGTVAGVTKAMVGLANVDNTTDAAKPVSTATQTALNIKLNAADTASLSSRINLRAPLASPTFTGTVAGVTAAMVGLGNVNNTTDAAKPVSTATQTALDAKSNATATTDALALKAPLASPTFTGTVSGVTATMVGLANVDNTTDAAKPVSTATQTALNIKLNAADTASLSSRINLRAPLASPTFTGTVSGITKAMVGLANADNTTDAAKPISTATQTALDAKSSNADVALKAPLASPTFTGTVSGITKTMVGLGDVNNTTDLLKPISTATQTALDAKSSNADVALKAPLASPTFTGTPVLPTGTTAITQTSTDNSTKLATTAFVQQSTASGAPDATTSATGKVQLAGDLTGTAASPTIAASAITTAKIVDANVTYGKIQNVSATDKVLGRVTSGSGIVEEISTVGSGNVVRATSPTLVTPVLGVASATTVNKLTLTAPATAATLTLADGSSLVTAGAFSQTLTATAATNVTLPSTGTLATLAGVESLSNKTFVAPALGTPASGVATNLTGTAASLTAGNVTTNANLTGEVTSSGNTATVPNATVIGKLLTGYTSGAGTIAETDNILEAIQKLNGNKATNANLTGPITSSGNATSVAAQTGTGTTFVMNTSPTLVTPVLGVASATSLATTAASPFLLTNGQLATIALTSQTVGATTLTIPDFANVADEFTFNTKAQTLSNKTFVAPVLGAATATSVNKLTITAPATAATLTIANGKTFTSSNTLTLAGTDASTLNIGAGGTLGSNAYTSTDYAPLESPTFTGTPVLNTATGTSLSLSGQLTSTVAIGTAPFVVTSTTPVANLSIGGNAATATTVTTNANLTGPITSSGNATSVAAQTGTGSTFVMNTSPTLVTPVLGVASATSLATSAASPFLLTNGQLATIALTTQTVGATTLTIPNFAGVADEFTFQTKAQTLSNKTFVAPALGTPASGVATNLSGTAANLTAGNVTTNANLTGEVTSSGNTATVPNATVIAKVLTGYTSGAGTIAATDNILEAIQKLNGNKATNANLTGMVTSVGNAASLGTFTSANLSGAVSDETGSGLAVFATSPTLVTPVLGVASATSLATSAASPFLLTNGQLATIALTSQTVGATTLTIPDFAGVADEFTFKTKAQTLSNKTFVAPVLGAATGTSLSVSGSLTSTVADGTAPFVVTSTTPVANLSIGGNAATATSVTTNANLTGDVTSSGNATTIGASKVVSAMIVDATIVNADIASAAAIAGTKIAPDFGSQEISTTGKFNKLTITAPATAATLTIANGKTFTSSNTLTLAGTDASTLNIGAGGTLGSNAYTSTGYAPLASPTFTGTPVLNTATGTSLSLSGQLTSTIATATGAPFVVTSTTPVANLSIGGNAATATTATNVSGTVAVANGGTGETTAAAAFNALSPMTASGDLVYGGTSGAGTRLGAGTNGQVLTLASGIPSWAAVAVSSTTYTVGLNSALGGYIFYVTPDGKHGLVAATQDQSATIKLYYAQDAVSTPANHNTNGKNFTDWRLPTKYELNLMYLAAGAIGGFSSVNYWSSSENDSLNAWAQFFASGSQDFLGKGNAYRVRAVRAF